MPGKYNIIELSQCKKGEKFGSCNKNTLTKSPSGFSV